MTLRFASLGSGSEGNALLVESASGATCTRILLDCGFGIRETVRRLERLGCAPESLNAILVTHEHSDHVGSAYAFAAKFNIPVWTSHGTYRATENLRGADRAAVRFCRADDMFCVGDLQILPYTVPHDAREPLQFVFNDGARRLGVLTDAGMSTEYLCTHLTGMHALVLECNHDREMLANSAYPWSLKRRIGGDFGHLANDIAAAILTRVRHDALHTVVAAHLSKQNNTPLLAAEAIAVPLGASAEDVPIADQEEGLIWRTV
ncbi:MBL fold metallo-hydrolase [Ralstonia holmesii]|uniref:MBL fold metallo-hydrolase n=1 Tax=Ralstonia TaxID=48736 RepID=UPI000469FB1F|nr:MBL fold metallo-hydrolase [Ralstonia pickettii]